MPYPHRIRLRGPWECEPFRRHGDNATQPLPPPFRVTMPCRWSEAGLSDFTGRVRFRRSFGYPGRLDAHERVWLTFAGIGGEAEVQLNDHLLGRIASTGEMPVPPTSEFDVTSLLRPRNQLVVEIEGSSEQGGLWGEVALEIRCTAFLRDLCSFIMSKGDRIDLHVSGQVVGVAERPLELYLLRDRSVVGYQVVTAAAEGQPFEIVAADLPAGNLPVQVDLVNGAVIWYTSNSFPVRLQGGETETDSDREK
jgi:hypothetical protein